VVLDVYIVHMNLNGKGEIKIWKNHYKSSDFFYNNIFIRNFITLYLFDMADGITYGINFPFVDSYIGKYLDASDTTDEEVRSSLVHLLLTRKGSRYYLPEFGTRLYEYIFEPLDGPTFAEIESEIRESVENFMPGILITNISITEATKETSALDTTYVNNDGQREFRTPNLTIDEHTAKIKIDYRNTNSAFSSTDFIIINI